MWWQRGFADSCDECVARRHQAEATAQRGHGQLCLQDVLCSCFISAGGEAQRTTAKNKETKQKYDAWKSATAVTLVI